MAGLMIQAEDQVFFTDGYKYRLEETVVFRTNFRPLREVRLGNVILTRQGLLIVLSGFSWDGATGAFNNKAIFKAALGHDALYALLRDRKEELTYRCKILRKPNIITETYCTFDELRLEADRFLIDISDAHGMWRLRQKWVYVAVRDLAFKAAYCQRPLKSM